jgi:cytochrome c
MDKWLVNMIAGAVLASLLVIFGTSTFIDIVYPTGGAPEAPTEIAGAATTEQGGAPGGQDAAPQLSLAAMLGQASVDGGQGQARKCAACHTFEEGGPNKIGPNLHGVVGREVASHEGFAYSPALQGFGGVWDYERLNCYIADPKGCVPGNKMVFAGIKKDNDRADVIAYLRSVTPNAPPLPEEPKGAEAPAATPDAPADQPETKEAVGQDAPAPAPASNANPTTAPAQN